ncbi:hypothetical protein ACN28S_19225 [Cystobacter fuscus]
MSSIDWPQSTGTCDGPFEYQLQCYKYLENSPSCGPSGRYYQKDCWRQCTLTRTVSKGPFTQVVFPDRNQGVYDYDGPCNQAAITIRSMYYPDQVSTIRTRYTYSLSGNADLRATCSVWLDNVKEQYLSEPNNPACGIPYQYSCDDESRPVYNNCRHPEHGIADLSECSEGANEGPDNSWSSTPQQQTPEEASESVKRHWTNQGNLSGTPVYVIAPRCVTCEDEATPSARYECLMRGLEQRNWQEIHTRYKLLMHLRLLYEFNAHELSADPVEAAHRRAKILAHLEQEETYPTCGKELAYLDESHPDTGNPDCTALFQHYFKLNFCARLTSDYVPVEASNTAFDYCAGLAPAFIQDYGTCRDTLASWRKDYQDTLYNLASRMVKESSTAPLTEAQVQKRLDAIQFWYDYALRAGQTPDPALLQQLDKLMGAFWKSLYDAEAPFDSNGSAAGGYRDVSQFVAEGLAVDNKVLRAAIANMARTEGGPQPKLKKMPLLLTLDGGLRTLANRLEDMVMLHDLGCRFRGCKAPESRTQVSELMGLLGSLHDPGALDVRLRRLATTGVVANEWRTLFQGLYDNRAVIHAALEEWMVPASTNSSETFASRFMKTDDSRWPSSCWISSNR